MSNWPMIAIKPSSYISAYCYSIFRLEPYGYCMFSCTYCYARWYRRGDSRPQYRVLKLWRKLARLLSRVEPKPFFRLATLADPFQPAEQVHQVSLEILRAALRYRVPLVVNTKSSLVSTSPWLDLLEEMARERLVVVQLSIAFTDKTSLLLEPQAPFTSERLRTLRALLDRGVPVVVRVQPLIPGLEEEHRWIADTVLAEGAMGLIGESIRETMEGFRRLSHVLGYSIEDVAGLEPYQRGLVAGLEPLYHPSAEWRRAIHEDLYAIARSYGALYGVCKEGFQLDPTIKDCCLTETGISVVARRPTLREVALTGSCSILPEGYYCTEELKDYPRIVRRAMKVHENKLRRLASTG